MCANIIGPIERAMKDDRVTALATALADLAATSNLSDANLFAAPLADRYARRMVWRDPEERFTIVAMTWGPGQGAQLHDHAGLWGAEIVVSGTMRECSYRPLERDPQRGTRFLPTSESVLETGAIGLLIPPLEYHSYRNDATTVSQTLHVYAGAFDACTAYSPSTSDWWTGERCTLNYDI